MKASIIRTADANRSSINRSASRPTRLNTVGRRERKSPASGFTGPGSAKETPSLYGEHCRPKLASLLEALGLDADFRSASGSVLTDVEGRVITDFVGGFGAALLGHNPPELKRLAIELFESDTPIHAQVSNREAAGRLGQRLSELMPSNARYLVSYSNSGTEAVETAIKHAYKVHLDKVRHSFEEIARETNRLYYQLESRELDAGLPGNKKAVDFRDDLDQHNLAQFEAYQKHPVVIALLGAFHGKTTSALKLTYNQSFREGFEGLSAIETHFIDPSQPERLREIVESKVCHFLRPVVRGDQIILEPAPVTRAMGFILELIQGEGGIRPVSEATLDWISLHHRALGLPLIVDEIQTGCGRTGTFFALEKTPLRNADPEYVVLSKSLGGGIVKIGATLIRSDILDHDFGITNTSTFGEDDFSCRIALRVVDMLTRENCALMREVHQKGLRLKEGLERLKNRYPDLVREVRGDGLMLGMEFTDLAAQSPFFLLRAGKGSCPSCSRAISFTIIESAYWDR